MRKPCWAAVLLLGLFAGLGCGEQDSREPVGEEGPEVAVSSQALTCPNGPAFPSCYGNCGYIDCGDGLPSACCACDDDCVTRGDCCCDYEAYCAAPDPAAACGGGGSCAGSCDGPGSGGCWCDSACSGLGDCCSDYVAECHPVDAGASCAGSCGGRAAAGCWCDTACTGYGDCCADYADTCACTGGVSPAAADERVHAIAVGPAGEVYVAGTRAPPVSFASDQVDGFLRRVDPVTFATLWDRTVDNCYWDSINDVAVLPGGDVVVVGATRNGPFGATPTRLLAARYGSAGNLVWQVTPDTTAGEVVGHAAAVDPRNGSIVVTGALTTPSQIQVLFARLDGLGGTRALTSLTALGAGVGRAVDVACDGQVGIVTRGVGSDAKVVSVSASGSVSWQRADVANSEGVGVAFDSAGNLVSLSKTVSATPRLASLSRWGNTGSALWTHTIDITSAHNNPAGGLALRSDDSAVVAGWTGTRPYVHTVSSSGATVSTRIGASISGLRAADGVALTGADALLPVQVSSGGSTTTQIIRLTP